MRLIILSISFYTMYLVVGCSPGNAPYIAKHFQEKIKYNTTPSKDIATHSVYLIGDAGKLHPNGNPVLQDLQKRIETNANPSTVVFLGDNIYPKGLPDSCLKYFENAKKSLDLQLNAVKNLQGALIFIPGNHDWAMDAAAGQTNVLNQQAYLEKKLHKKVFYPSNGCPGPETQLIDSKTVIIAIDTQWWLHPHIKPYGYPCSVYSDADFAQNLKDTLKKYADYEKIVVGHHPTWSSGSHNGSFGFKKHLFPLTDFNKKAYIPLPILGSLFVAWRSFRGFRQDLHYPRYTLLRHQLAEAFAPYPNLIYASGHEHHLGYYHLHDYQQIVSGAGSKANKIFKGKKALFAQSTYGYARLDYFKNYKTLTFFTYNQLSHQFDTYQMKIE